MLDQPASGKHPAGSFSTSSSKTSPWLKPAGWLDIGQVLFFRPTAEIGQAARNRQLTFCNLEDWHLDRAAKWRSGETSQERCQCCGNRAGRISREFRSTSVIRPAATSTCAAWFAGTRAKRRPFPNHTEGLKSWASENGQPCDADKLVGVFAALLCVLLCTLRK